MQISADTARRALTEQQTQAASSIDHSTAVLAGAGSGKTTVLIERCLSILGDNFSELDRILLITFTEKAAAELKSRLRIEIDPRHRYRTETSWIGTFHSCFMRMLRSNAASVGLDPSFQMLDENTSKLAMKQTVRSTILKLLEEDDPEVTSLIDALDFKTTTTVLEELLSFRWQAKSILELPAKEDSEEAKIISALKSLFERSELRLSKHYERINAIDFQDLEIRALKLLAENNDILTQYRKKFRHILVDEFQDTNDIQTEFVLKLHDPAINKLCIVGDTRQSIYKFRGANVGCLSRVLGEIVGMGGKEIALAENFRSKKQIVEFVNCYQSISAPTSETNSAPMIASRADDSDRPSLQIIPINLDPKTRNAERRSAEAKLIAEFIRTSGLKFGEITCLFQALTQLSSYEAAFREAQIPYRIFGGRGILERQEVIDLICALRWIANQNDSTALLGLLRSPLISLSDDELILLAGERGKDLQKNAMKDERCHLLRELIILKRGLPASEILRRTIEITGFEEILTAMDPSGGMVANIDRLVTMCSEIERERPSSTEEISSLLSWLKENNARISDPPVESDDSQSVKLMSVHAAKGLEFNAVILPDLFRKRPNNSRGYIFSRNAGLAFKLKDPLHPFGDRIETERFEELKEAELTEEELESKRLLYVAMTRAKDLLVLPLHLNIKASGDWHKWIEESCAHFSNCDSDGITPWRQCNSSPKNNSSSTAVEPIKMMIDKGKELKAHPIYTASQLECMDRCPQEYYLKYILGLPAQSIISDRTEMASEIPANVFGSIMHRALELASSPNDIDCAIRSTCLANGIEPNTRIIDSIRTNIASALAMPYIQNIESGRHELRFDWRYLNRTITGSIDWMRESGDQLEIIDFKTDRVDGANADELARNYEMQLITYALAAEAATGKEVCKTTLIFLRPQIVHHTDMTSLRREAAAAKIKSIMEAIESREFTIHSANHLPCNRCPYHHNSTCWLDRMREGRVG